MSAEESRRAVARVVAKQRELGAEGFAAYALLVLGLLADQAPEVIAFLMDHADEQPADVESVTAALPGAEVTVERVDKYTISVGGTRIRANEEQEGRIRALSVDERRRLVAVHGGRNWVTCRDLA